MRYAVKELLEKSNDSTYIGCDFSYFDEGEWNELQAEIRIRGGFRRTFCFFTPLKLKIPSEAAQGSLFETDRKAKLVMPCLKSKKADDNLLKEYLAYKIFEVLSPYHFKTRPLELELELIRGGKSNSHKLLAFMIQDDSGFERHNDAREIERFIQHSGQNEKYRVINALFQFMIGNTDFSTVYLHNEKLFYVDDMIVPVPYDFDMSGLVDASYAVVSQVRNEVLPIDQVTTRLYRGFRAEPEVMEEVRQHFLQKEQLVFEEVEKLESYFQNPKEFEYARTYLDGFYQILRDDKKFNRRIVEKGRKK